MTYSHINHQKKKILQSAFGYKKNAAVYNKIKQKKKSVDCKYLSSSLHCRLD